MMTSGISGFVFDAWLASASMPSGLLLKILEQYGEPESCHDAFRRNSADLTDYIPPRFYRILKGNDSDEFLNKMDAMMKKHSIRVIRIHDAAYPEALADISEPPAMLFYQGNPNCLNGKILAMVGSRKASYTGQKATARLSEELSSKGVSIVSGLACGIDASAHQGCIDGGSPTIAVTGCGLDRVYPADNRTLRDRILNGGGILLSEYAPGEKPAGWHFPVRNRIITGIAEALILMEARIRSGSLTSVHHALDQGKDVFVYPGDPSSEYFEGNHQLLREGGTFFTSAEDILEDLGWLDNKPTVRHNNGCLTAAEVFTPEEKLITDTLKPGSLSFEELLNHTGIEPSGLLSTLTILQIRGIVEALPGKKYQIKH